MAKPNDLPGALPLAIAAGLLALVLAPWLGSEDESCSHQAETVSSVSDRTSLIHARTGSETSAGAECR